MVEASAVVSSEPLPGAVLEVVSDVPTGVLSNALLEAAVDVPLRSLFGAVSEVVSDIPTVAFSEVIAVFSSELLSGLVSEAVPDEPFDVLSGTLSEVISDVLSLWEVLLFVLVYRLQNYTPIALHANMNTLRCSYFTVCDMSDTQCRCSRSDRAHSSRGYIRVMVYSSCGAIAVHLVIMLPLDCSAVHIKAHERLTAFTLRYMRLLLSPT